MSIRINLLMVMRNTQNSITKKKEQRKTRKARKDLRHVSRFSLLKKNELHLELCLTKFKIMEFNEIVYAEEVYEIQGAIFEVYKEIGCGFLESVYQECLEKELELQEISFESQVNLQLNYKGMLLKQRYKPDFICFDKVIIEIKSVKELANEHKAQLINYLKATDMKVGLLVNFGSYPKVEIKRLINL